MHIFILSAIALIGFACSKPVPIAVMPYEEPDQMCVVKYVQNTEDTGTITLYHPSESSVKFQDIEEVSVKVAEEITGDLGLCDGIL